MLRFACPVCDAVIQAPEEHVGMKLACPKCSQRLQVPSPAAANKTVLGSLLPGGGAGPARPGAPAAAGGPAAKPAPPRDRGQMLWHYQRGGQRYGPVPFAGLQELTASLRIAPDDLVWAEGMGQWLPAGKVKGLFPDPAAGRARRWWGRFRALRPVTQAAMAAGLCACLIAAAALGVWALSAGGPEPEGTANATAPPDEADAELARLRREVKAAEERAAAEKAVAERLRREAEAAEGKAAAETDRLKRDTKAAEERAAAEKAALEKLRRDLEAAEARAAAERAAAEKLRQQQAALKKAGPQPDPELSTEEVVRRCEPSVALIRTPVGFGTGFVVRPGVLATNAHVIESGTAERLEVYFPSAGEDGKKRRPVDHVLYWDRKRDLALLSVPAPHPPLRLADKFLLRRGQAVTVIGNPGLGRGQVVIENAVCKGVVSAEVSLPEGHFLQLNVGVNGGNSGGPVLDPAGQVIGVIKGKSLTEEAMAFCVPVTDLRKAIDSAEGRSPEARAKLTSQHNARVVFRRTARAGRLYGLGCAAVEQAWVSAAKQFGNVQKGDLDAARAKFHALLVQKGVAHLLEMGDVEAAVAGVGTDQSLPEATRQQLAELWSSYKGLRDYYLRPGLNFNEFTRAAGRYIDGLEDRVNSLRITLGVEEDELKADRP